MQFVKSSPTEKMENKREQRELQELTGKLIDECARIGGSCLEQTTWLRRNLAVKPQVRIPLCASHRWQIVNALLWRVPPLTNIGTCIATDGFPILRLFSSLV